MSRPHEDGTHPLSQSASHDGDSGAQSGLPTLRFAPSSSNHGQLPKNKSTGNLLAHARGEGNNTRSLTVNTAKRLSIDVGQLDRMAR